MNKKGKRSFLTRLAMVLALSIWSVSIAGCGTVKEDQQPTGCEIYEKSNGDLEGSTGKIDYQNHTYAVVRIGNQWWMAENLRSDTYNDGTPILNLPDRQAWKASTEGAWCAYGNDSLKGDTYGKLYNWPAVNSGKLAPPGWRVPSDDDLIILIERLGGMSEAGGKMKETGDAHWEARNVGATNESGFTAFGSGYRNENGAFAFLGKYTYFWSASEKDSTTAWARKLVYYGTDVLRYGYGKNSGFSVRCVRN
jgi:uncharacterized protein (TIGR02145 family)